MAVFSEIREVEKRDSVLTKEQQIKRLTKPGSKYGNLNPYAVLMISYDVDLDAARKQFRKLSILTHPDKNPEQKVIKTRFTSFSNSESNQGTGTTRLRRCQGRLGNPFGSREA